MATKDEDWQFDKFDDGSLSKSLDYSSVFVFLKLGLISVFYLAKFLSG